jgi:serine/threonine-protein kinase
VRATTVSEPQIEEEVTQQVPPTPVVGTELGPYRLTALLGSGGMGMVFVGEHMMLGRRMAIKVLLPDLALRLDIIQRFFKEARSANEIAHENIVEIFDFVQAPGGLSYLVMELLSGHDVGIAVANEGPFKLKRTLHIIRQVASALAAAHEKRIVHRDLKPENIFLIRRAGDADFVKLLDFGLAKVSESMSGIPENTQVGTIMGTPEYMSPEQAMGVPVDVRSDIYSLAIVLYWMICGTLPFEGSSFEQQRKARVSFPAPALPAVSNAGEPVPAELIALVARCLSRPPEDRCQNGREFLAAIDALPPLADFPSLPPPPPRAKAASIPPTAVPDSQPDSEAPSRSHRGRWIAVASIAVVAAGIAGFVAFQQHPPPARPMPVTHPGPPPGAGLDPDTASANPTNGDLAPPPAPILQPPLTPPPIPEAQDPMVRSPRHTPGSDHTASHKPKPKVAHPKHAAGSKTPEPLLPFPD